MRYLAMVPKLYVVNPIINAKRIEVMNDIKT